MSRRAPITVVCAGRTYGDLILSGMAGNPEPGTETYCSSMEFQPGGGAAITAAHLVANGLRAGLLSMMPAAPFDGPLRARLSGLGVDLAWSASAIAGTDPQLTVAIVQGDDRMFLTRRDGPALPAGAAAQVAKSGASHLHIGELTTLVEHPDLLEAAAGHGMTVSLDCGWDPQVFDTAHGHLIRRVDVFFPNSSEAEALLEAGFQHPIAGLDVVKLGPQGALAITKRERILEPTNTVPVRDPTGAGDAFNAGFLVKWLGGEDLRTCLAAGNTAGALAVSHVGGTGGLTEVARPLPGRAITAS